jgi:hypothetical protein
MTAHPAIDQYQIISEQLATGIETVHEAMKIWNLLFYIDKGWFASAGEVGFLKMVPASIQGLGVWRRSVVQDTQGIRELVILNLPSDGASHEFLDRANRFAANRMN